MTTLTTDPTRLANHKPGQRVRYGWKTELSKIIKANNHMSVDGDRKVGTLTRQSRIEKLYLGFKQLHELNFKLENPANFSEKHMRALVSLWESQNLSSSTIQNRISVFRTFAEWIGKKGMVRKSEEYASTPDVVKRSQVAQEDKSWSAKDIDMEKLLLEIEGYSKHAAAQLLMIRAFGLRRLEAICFKPNLHWETVESLEHGLIRVRDGTKGGRERVLLVQTEDQVNALLYAKQVVKNQRNASIGFPDMTRTQSCHRYNYIMKKFGLTKSQLGVTGHGLRHQYANDRYEELTGQPSPVRANNVGKVQDKEADIAARYKVSEALGHSRISVTAAYYGSNRPAKTEPAAVSKAKSNKAPEGQGELNFPQ